MRPKKTLKYLLLNIDPSELVTHFLFRVVLLYCRGSAVFQSFALALFPDESKVHSLAARIGSEKPTETLFNRVLVCKESAQVNM